MSRPDRLRELELLAGLDRTLTSPGDGVLTWVGDDAAVTEQRGAVVTSVDQTVLGVHADPDFFDHRSFGSRAVLGALSDLAAMGAVPSQVLLALTIPDGTSADQALEVIHGADSAAVRNGAVITGGDVSSGPGLAAAVTVIGHPGPSGRLVTRSGAVAGDLVGVTGSLGGSGAGLAVLRGATGPGQLAERHRSPVPRLAEGAALAAVGIHAMIDLSDGLATDAGHVGRASGVNLVLDPDRFPLDDGVAEVAIELGREPGEFAATAGEDFELLVCVDPGDRAAAERACEPTGLTWIGEVEDGEPGCTVTGSTGLRGWEHSF